MPGLLIRLKNKRQVHRRRRIGRNAAGGSGFFMLAALAFLASFSPFTFLPFMAAAIGLAILGALVIAVQPLTEFLW